VCSDSVRCGENAYVPTVVDIWTEILVNVYSRLRGHCNCELWPAVSGKISFATGSFLDSQFLIFFPLARFVSFKLRLSRAVETFIRPLILCQNDDDT
jgi:hypothetical protein